MATDSLEIVNTALMYLRARYDLTDLTVSASSPNEVRAGSLIYDRCRKQALSAYDWNFARQRALLVAHADAPPAGIWTFRYALPANFLKAREIENVAGPNANPIPFDIELSLDGTEKTLVTDYGDGTPANAARLICTYDLTDTTLFNPHFDDTLSYLIAWKIAYAVTGKPAIEEKMRAEYQGMLAQAAAIDGNEAARRPPREAEAVTGRG